MCDISFHSSITVSNMHPYFLWNKIKEKSSLCIFLCPPDTSNLIGQNILLNTLFCNAVSLLLSHITRDQVSHPYNYGNSIIYRLTYKGNKYKSEKVWVVWREWTMVKDANVHIFATESVLMTVVKFFICNSIESLWNLALPFTAQCW
jgi:hypothetical protein